VAIPDFQTLMRPMLEFAADGKEHSVREAREFLSARFKLTAAELGELLPSGRQPAFTNRVAWAKVYLQQAGGPGSGVWYLGLGVDFSHSSTSVLIRGVSLA